VVANISEAQRDAVEKVAQQLREEGLRVETDLRNEKISYKIRTHSLQKVPYQLVMGDREAVSGQASVRLRGGKDLGAQPVEVVVSRMKAEILARSELTD
ncbi:His/Gly/Thr/Pro-type tRNA ligase C-terminal domain-containing protein, partial [Ferrovum sp.]